MARKEHMVVMGVFDDAVDAERAITRMTALGVPRDQISIVAHPRVAAFDPKTRLDDAPSVKGGAFAQTATLAATLVGIGLFAVPLGAVLVAGPIALLGGLAAFGAAPYGSPDSLVELGVKREDAKLAIEAVRRGGIVVVAQSDERGVRDIAAAMDRAGAIDLRGRALMWEAEGWSYEPNAPMWSAEEIERERAVRRPRAVMAAALLDTAPGERISRPSLA